MNARLNNLNNFTDVFGDEINNSQPISLSPDNEFFSEPNTGCESSSAQRHQVTKGTGQHGPFRSIDEIDPKYRGVFTYPYFNLVQSKVIEDALYSDKSLVVCAPTGSGKTVIFEMAIVQLLMDLEEQTRDTDFKIIYMAPVKALCTERLTEWYPKFTRLGLLCIEVTGDTDVDFSQLKPYKIIITTPEKWDMLTRRWRDHRGLVEMIKLFLIDEVHILNDGSRGPVLEAVVSRMKTVESSAQSAHRIEALQKQYDGNQVDEVHDKVTSAPRIRFVAVSATVSNPEDVADWLGTSDKLAVFHKFDDECRPVKLRRIVEGYPCTEGTSIFKFDIILNYKLWPIIQKYYNGKPTLIFCNTRKSVTLTAEMLSKELTINFNSEQKVKLNALASTIKNKKLQALVLSGVGCHHAGLLFEERNGIEQAFRNRDLPILITTTTLAMGVNLPAHLVIVKNTQQYVNGAYQEYSISTVLQMVGRAGRPQFDTEATAVIMTRLCDKPRYQALVGGSEPLQSYLHKRLSENLNSEAALGTVGDVAQCVQWLRSTFLNIRAAKDPKRYLGLPITAPPHQISKKIEELCVKAMNRLAGAGLITMDEACCIQSTDAGRLMSLYYLDLETMKNIMKIEGEESLERMLCIVCESQELSDMHLRVDERRCLNALNRNHSNPTIRFPMKGKISTRQMKLNCVIQAILGCLPIPDPPLNQEAMKIMRIAERVCKCLVAYITRSDLITTQPKYFNAVLSAVTLAKCVKTHLWENSPFVSKQLKGIGPSFSTLLATAGKVNFLLLEESHPRDLERIMNKNAPSGNVLRKQISLLPKYQITMTPVDEATVCVKLILLNQNFLSENIDNLTAGENHKCFVISGDSDNSLLLFSSFRDKDLICLYDGTITFNVTRKLNTAHKIIVHCISTDFVGIDVQGEYSFNSLEPFYNPGDVNTLTNDETKIAATKQTCITDTFKERKRKNNVNGEIAQSREKKRRDNATIEKLRILKESFGVASKELKEDFQRSETISNRILCDLTNKTIGSTHIDMEPITEKIPRYNITEILEPAHVENFNLIDDETDDLLDDVAFDNILNDIESEIGTKKATRTLAPETASVTTKYNDTGFKKAYGPKQPNSVYKSNSHTIFNSVPKKTRLTNRSNFSFLDSLENTSLTNEEQKENPKSSTQFSDSIKSHIERYLQNAKMITNQPSSVINNIVLDQSPGYDSLCNIDEKMHENNTEYVNSKNTDYDQTSNLSGKENDVLKKYEGPDAENDEINQNQEHTLKRSNTDREIIKMMDETEREIQNLQEIPKHHEKTNLEFRLRNGELLNDSIFTVNSLRPYNDKKTLPIFETNTTVMNPRSLVLSKPPHPKIEYDIIPNRPFKLFTQLDDFKLPTDIQYFIPTKNTQLAEVEANEILKPHVLDTKYCNKKNVMVNSASYLPLHLPNVELPTNSKTFTDNSYHRYNTTNDKSQSIRKFSYKTVKTDIRTKTTPSHQIQVIRNLKVDLDITEIVSCKNNKSPNIVKNQYNDTVNNSYGTVEKKLSNEEGILCNDLLATIENCKSPKLKKRLVEDNNYGDAVEDIVSPTKQNKERLDGKKSLPVNCKMIPERNYNNNKTVEDIVSPTKQKKERLDGKKSLPDNCKMIPERNYNNNKTVEDIISKYNKLFEQKLSSQILREDSINNTTDTKGEVQLKSQTCQKRPFRICDIDTINAPLPSFIVDDVQRPKVSYVYPTFQLNEQTAKPETADIDFVSNEQNEGYYEDFSQVVNENQNDVRTEDIREIEEEPDFQWPVETSNLVPAEPSSFDNSMFDPKALLQHLGHISKDQERESEEIIPPPSEFCNHDQPFENVTGSADDCYFQDDLEVLDSTNSEVLTPSKEIETWTFTTEPEVGYSGKDGESQTVIRQQMPNFYNNLIPHFIPNSFCSRRENLHQFKFTRKKKLQK